MDQNKTKRGVASLYVVIFATILFGVVTLSFMRIILSEASQSSDDDLSRSAYDAAMAGVEDAKTAVNRYYACLSAGGGEDCDGDDRSNLFQDHCDGSIGIAKYLYSYDQGEVLVQQNAASSAADNNSDQAYTCVTIRDTVPDYRGTLSSDTRTKVIPLAVYNGDGAGSNASLVKRIKFEWFSSVNAEDAGRDLQNTNNGGKLGDINSKTTPPTISLTFIRVGAGATNDDFFSVNDTPNLNYDTLILLPSENGRNEFDVREAGNINHDNNNPAHTTSEIKCNKSSDFYCSATLTGLPNGMSEQDSILLVASLPYGDTVTDFAATMLKDDGSSVPLKGAQISVDSTGRTNQLVRRVETRLDPADLFFPYPQYELELTGDGDSNALKKNFWITANCWKSEGGGAQLCGYNNAEISE